MTVRRRKQKETVAEGVDLGVIEMRGVANFETGEVEATEAVEFKIYKAHPQAPTPEYATRGSACFDLRADFSTDDPVTIYTAANDAIKFMPRAIAGQGDEKAIILDAGQRALIPTGLIFDVPTGFKMLIYPRSGLALKQGLALSNCVGVVDSDYVEPTFVVLQNNSSARAIIKHGDKIAQAEFVPAHQVSFSVTDTRPERKTEREGGFGSTGK